MKSIRLLLRCSVADAEAVAKALPLRASDLMRCIDDPLKLLPPLLKERISEQSVATALVDSVKNALMNRMAQMHLPDESIRLIADGVESSHLCMILDGDLDAVLEQLLGDTQAQLVSFGVDKLKQALVQYLSLSAEEAGLVAGAVAVPA